MTTPKRTHEEIAKWLWTEMAIIWGWDYRQIPAEKNTAMVERIEAALREAADAARETATEIHTCKRIYDHRSKHVCPCGATHERKR